MDASKLVFIAVSFIVVIGLFVFALFRFILIKPEKKSFNFDDMNQFSMQTVMLVLGSKTSTLSDLNDVVEKFFNSYESIGPSRLELRNMCLALAMHRSADKDIILGTQKRLVDLNPDLQNELERAVKKGLDAR